MSSSSISSVGIDVSRDELEVAWLKSDGQVTRHTYVNDTKGCRALASACKKHGMAKATPCVFESTGDFHLLSALTLARAGLTVKVINPLITKQYEKSDIRGAKTDRIDAARLAQIGKDKSSLPSFSPDKANICARKILSSLAILDRTEQQMRSHQRRWQTTQEQLDLPAVSHLDEVLSAIKQEKERLLTLLKELVPAHVKQLVEQTKGLSLDQAAIVHAALSGASFTRREQLVAYLGLDIRVRQSGRWRGREHLSKRGRPYVRKVLYQIAWGLVRNNHEPAKLYYERLRAAGKPYTVALIAVARKFLRYWFTYAYLPMA